MAMNLSPRPASDPEFTHSLTYLLDTAIWHWNQRLATHLPAMGINFEQWRLLLVSSQLPSQTIRELSNATLVPHSTIGRWITALEASGLLARRSDPTDNRAVRIDITPAGLEVFSRVAPLAQAAYKEGIAGFDAAEIETLKAMLERIINNLA